MHQHRHTIHSVRKARAQVTPAAVRSVNEATESIGAAADFAGRGEIRAVEDGAIANWDAYETLVEDILYTQVSHTNCDKQTSEVDGKLKDLLDFNHCTNPEASFLLQLGWEMGQEGPLLAGDALFTSKVPIMLRYLAGRVP